MIEKADNLTKAQKEELFKRIQQLHKNLIDKRIILVDGIISNPIGKQIEEVIDILEKTGDTADMYINSPGGSTQAFLGIIEKIKSSKLKIKTICLEQAGSGAMLLLAMGNERLALPYSEITTFNYLWVKETEETKTDEGMIEAGKAIIKTKNDVEKIYKEITKEKGIPLLKELFNAKKITAEEAIQYGIIDKITGR